MLRPSAFITVTALTCSALLLLPTFSLSGQERLPIKLDNSGAGEHAPRTATEQHVIEAYKRANKAVVNVGVVGQSFDMFGA